MIDDEEFNLFDDKQIEQLNAVEEPQKEDLAADDTTTDTADQGNDDSASEENQADSEGTDDSSDTSDGEESSEADKSDEDASADKADEDKDASADASSDQDTQDDGEKEQFATKEDIKNALAEQAAIAEAQQTGRKTLRNELRSELFPEGIDVDLQIKDSDNGIITGPSQIAGKLINPKTQELFTYEEAKDYWDNAQKQIDKTIEEREQLIDSYAENNQSFYEGAQIIEAKYGKWLKANPEDAKKLLDNYLKTAKMTTSGYITEMPLNVVDYYETALGPVNNVARQMELQAQGEEQKKASESEKANQSDRADLPVNSTTTPPAKEDKLDSAFSRYFGGK